MSKKKIVAIKVDTKPVKWVSTTSNRPDKSVAVELTEDPNSAHDFVTEANAQGIIGRIHNPWERVFTMDVKEVERKETNDYEFESLN